MQADKLELSKAQGFYETPVALASDIVDHIFSGLSFQNLEKYQFSLVEPAAGTGVFVIAAWNYWLQKAKKNEIPKNILESIIKNTICYEVENDIFSRLTTTIDTWLTKNKIRSKPTLICGNFLLIQNGKENDVKNLVMIGNPPWDEFTTRKHDQVKNDRILKIRSRRNEEKSEFSNFGFRNIYQAFVQKIITIPCKNIHFGMVLPRQILGDKSSSSIRKDLILGKKLEIFSYENFKIPKYFFTEVDRNFQIVCLFIQKKDQSEPYSQIHYLETLGSKNCGDIPFLKSDFSIPCPRHFYEIDLVKKLFSREEFGQWVNSDQVVVKMGPIKCTDNNYLSALSGKKIYPFGGKIQKKTNYIAINKILPNSQRKLKAAFIGDASQANESLVVAKVEDPRLAAYLFFMLNSKAIEFSLRAIVSNINLNIFRLKSLPIPQPSRELLDYSYIQFVNNSSGSRFMLQKFADLIASDAFALSKKDELILNEMLPDHKQEKTSTKAA